MYKYEYFKSMDQQLNFIYDFVGWLREEIHNRWHNKSLKLFPCYPWSLFSSFETPHNLFLLPSPCHLSLPSNPFYSLSLSKKISPICILTHEPHHKTDNKHVPKKAWGRRRVQITNTSLTRGVDKMLMMWEGLHCKIRIGWTVTPVQIYYRKQNKVWVGSIF